METDIRIIKYMLFALAASFVFSCVAEAQTSKHFTAACIFPPHTLLVQKEQALPNTNRDLAL